MARLLLCRPVRLTACPLLLYFPTSLVTFVLWLKFLTDKRQVEDVGSGGEPRREGPCGGKVLLDFQTASSIDGEGQERAS